MTYRSLALASDAVTMQGLSTFEDHGDHIVQRTRAEPDYWHGNIVIMKDCRNPLADVGHFARHFPDATHHVTVWDIPNLDPAPIAAVLKPQGFDIDTFDVLALNGPLSDAAMPSGIILRELNHNDWPALTDLQIEVSREDGYDPASHRPYLERRNIARQRQIAEGLGTWFGAFDGDLIVGSMGLFHDTSIARYQAVETRASHRRRGICAALLSHSHQWLHPRAPQATTIIVAEADSNAGRLYRRAGFTLAETLVEATKPGY
ncbi:GNAT family N-acetyltransferase [Yoonia sp. 2307UL14-13]|uniref:GNAT family N-acetyltransferase n=1 Tax=Yoonia sp. 2307UL14-13 TaxID=3126506 RepID=UPI0030B29F9B